MGKHVIILGAGASHTSGYPLAAGLRVIMSSSSTFDRHVRLKIPINRSTGEASDFLNQWFSKQVASIRLFREGGFGTVDEFSFLAGKEHPEEVHQMKQLVGMLLALHSPENRYDNPLRPGQDTSGFETSDYYPFIQRLFNETDAVRDDVSILSYNYDPYLEFLLSRAFLRRRQASGNKNKNPPTQLTSGFGDRDAETILNGKGFCLLKLHGTCVLPPQPSGANTEEFLTSQEVFEKRDEWLQLTHRRHLFSSMPSPAMFFPWELIDSSGAFVAAEAFQGLESLAIGNEYFDKTERSLHALCKAIWERGRREINEATKISFVGLSMHKFLESGLKFLFSERVQRIEKEEPSRKDRSLEIVLACPGASYPGADFKQSAPPGSPASRLISTLVKINPTFDSISAGNVWTPRHGKVGSGGIVCYDSFSSFINSEL